MAQAISYMCEPGPDFNVSKVEEIFAEAEAYAFAQVLISPSLRYGPLPISLRTLFEELPSPLPPTPLFYPLSAP